LISLVDEEEVFFKAGVGMGNVKSAGRGVSLCSLAILSPEPTVIVNPVEDPCLLANPLVHGAFGLRFYAAAPLITTDGYRIGAVCIVDKEQRSFSKKQEQQLIRFSKVVMHEMNLRLSVRLREKELEKETRQRQRIVTNAVIQATERERTRMGLELHDNVSQMLTTVKLYTEIALDGSIDTRDMLKKSSQYLQDCINEIRFISHQLSTPTLGDITLEESVKELVESINVTGKVLVHSTVNGFENVHLSEDFHLCIYRIVQEQLNNILKYADAAEVFIILLNTKSGITLSISDDGKGFDTKAKIAGIGLINMKARTENFGGTLCIESAPGKGCQLRAIFPPL
jgi:signal transduction histidine kinase